MLHDGNAIFLKFQTIASSWYSLKVLLMIGLHSLAPWIFLVRKLFQERPQSRESAFKRFKALQVRLPSKALCSPSLARSFVIVVFLLRWCPLCNRGARVSNHSAFRKDEIPSKNVPRGSDEVFDVLGLVMSRG
jgi:hypothetical protein